MADNKGLGQYEQLTEKLILWYDVSTEVQTMWKSSGIEVQLNVNCSF